jgi:hypothetical protein
MVTHKLNLETEAHDQDIICVNTALPAYVFVFELNKLLGLSLFRCEEDLVPYVANHTFAVYEYNSAVMQQTWRVIENRFNTTIFETENSLFAQSEQRFCLFPELEQTDLLVCVNSLSEEALKRITTIGRVVSCYRLPKKFNSIKEQLTF